MADAEDLKSSGDFSSCGFDSHPGHHSFLLTTNDLGADPLPIPLVYSNLQKNERIAALGGGQIHFQLYLLRARPCCKLFPFDSRAVVRHRQLVHKQGQAVDIWIVPEFL
jgi:hypothetical protein